ncbi:putative autophagy-related protein [Clavispora lusitaniae]|uniref:Autophagy-related protein n=1 Tax=Clavispora lusitaniae TaxID=36911 RepID=A0ACD0WI28_CLALS|nr:putative autophagy-related protein [Clavispora lusitaniae]QFZ32632.1 putative autophagy-related protein [Clavispora lusitaniae]QFZ38301.1 putative autophagy-related protein [Clavispora lusitaniae]QFZ43984.1 putative autophagy-related protein [Clavispora lusitaniae]QFZ49661.1 putative autophagy-related protein [Clavispora lusitaniae]
MLKSQVAGNAYMNYSQQFSENKAQDNSETMSASHEESEESNVNFITFNQDATCVAVGLSTGYKIYTFSPKFLKCYDIKKNESVGILEMLYSTSLMAIVPLGEEPGSSPRKLKIVNTKRGTTICDLIFPSTVLSVKLSRHRMVVVLEEQIYIYDIATMKLLHTIETSPNASGLCTLSDAALDESGNTLLAYPSPPKTITHDSLLVTGINTNGGLNSVQNNIQSVSNAPNRVGDVIIFDMKSLQPLAVIEAHKSALAAMCLSSDGKLLATASDKGTIVRVFNVETGVKMFQFRRGTYPTTIYSLNFSKGNNYVIATSSSGTVHIFRLGEEELLANKQRHIRNSTPRKPKVSPGYSTIDEEAEEVSEAPKNGDDDDAESIEDDSDSDADGEEVVDGDPEGFGVPSKQRKLSQGSSSSFNSTSSTGLEEHRTEPIIDQNRLSVARLIRRSSQTLGRKAAQKMGDFLPSRFSSILEPTRNFASLKIQTNNKDVKSIAIMSTELFEDMVPQNILLPREQAQDNGLLPVKSSSSSNSGKDVLAVNLIHINVVTSEGYFYTYGLDPERGGDCILLHQYSLLDD